MGVDEKIRRSPEGARVAVVGAGPSGCLLAIALLDAAQARRRPLQVFLFHGGGTPHGQVVLDASAVTRLAGAGIQLPDFASTPLQGVRAVKGRAQSEQSLPLFAVSRALLLERLRAAAQERGAQLLERAVDGIHPAGDGGFTVRSSGASLRAEAVVLACGAGAPIAARLEGHQPPPLWRCCEADLEVEGDDAGVGPWSTRVHGDEGLPDLWLLGTGADGVPGLEQALAVGADVSPSDMAEALLAAVASGRVPPLHLRNPRRTFLPAGVARPSLPALGDALGGAPAPWRLANAAANAQSLAAAFFDGGPDAMLAFSRSEALRLDARVRRSLRDLRRWSARPADVVERAVAREGGRAPAWQPARRTLAASAAPEESTRSPLLLALFAWFAFFAAWLSVVWDGMAGGRAQQRPRPAGRVFVVDDDLDQAELISEYLESRGVPCVAFGDGMTAVAAAARERPAAVVLDVALPWIDGPTVCRTLRRQANIPVFLTTALPLSLARPGGHASGATAVMSKPLDLAGLAMRLQAWVPVGPPGEPRQHMRQRAAPEADAAQPPG